MSSLVDQESERIRNEYRRRQVEIPADYYSLARPVNLFFQQGQERALRWGLEYANLFPLAERKVLDVGCGQGDWLIIFELCGAKRQNLAGIELRNERVEEALERLSGADVRLGDATNLPWCDSSFDIVFQRTVFTSILEFEVKRRMASEMLRILRPSGAIVWIDFAFNNPKNPHVQGIRLSEVRALFPNCKIASRRITLMPPLARKLVPISWLFAEILQSITLLNTHRLCVIKPATPLDAQS